MQPANSADIHFHSFWQNPYHKGKKTHVTIFTGQKFHLQLVIGPTADFLFLTLKSWFYSCMQPANSADIHFHSFWQNPYHKGKKTHVTIFTGQKFHLQLVIGQILISHLWEKPSNLSEFVQSITNQFFSS